MRELEVNHRGNLTLNGFIVSATAIGRPCICEDAEHIETTQMFVGRTPEGADAYVVGERGQLHHHGHEYVAVQFYKLS